MIITLCGSARFEPWFHIWNRALGLAGHCVFGLSSYPSEHGGNKDWYTPRDKVVLDAVHRDKIAASDAVLILNAFAYIGESTLSEVNFAIGAKRDVYMLESWGKGCGVGRNHFDTLRCAAKALGVSGARSPIEATVGPYLFPFDLFGDGGEQRTRLVALVRDEEERVIARLAAAAETSNA
jgi:hypothetical protein